MQKENGLVHTTHSKNILIVIPARGNSKGIPRKNVRALNSKPLIYYTIHTALQLDVPAQVTVLVSSDDDEILAIAQKLGAETLRRDDALAEDHTTLDPVIFHAYQQAKDRFQKEFDLIVTQQPTSPLLKASSLAKAIRQMLARDEIDTIISAVDDTHLSWGKKGDRFVPKYQERLNRQYLPPAFRESGGFLITRNRIISEHNRIGNYVDLFLLEGEEAIDIDTYEDWNLAEYYLRRKKLLFVVTGHQEVGLGHVYRALGLANEILDHEIVFLVDQKSDLGRQKIADANYPVFQQQSVSILDDIHRLQPDVVINDILDTDQAYVQALKAANYKVVNFEDLGPGAREADLVINALYPEGDTLLPDHFFGHQYISLKSEFYLTPKKEIADGVKQVLLTFGGTDPNNYTRLVLKSIYDYCVAQNIKIEVIAGLGYDQHDTLAAFSKINTYRNINNMSDHMLAADVVFTSAGRTTYEVASIGVPTIVMAQNERELSHFFADQEYGFINLGLGHRLNPDAILTVFADLVQAPDKRRHMHKLMLANDIQSGKPRVIRLLKDLIQYDKE